ncbi:uncharacterized protein [Rutidosis leptorrhynchoides]|uniref:uncharacterized protein n=1 Tax=Rutidosis leptorrhynchoides TaxID=125765 RepID=UPI003A990939
MKPGSTAKDAWDRIKNIFQENKNSRAIHVQHKFTNICLDDFPNISAYCQEVKLISDQLATVAPALEENSIVLQLILGLNDNYDTIGSQLAHMVPLPSFYATQLALILEESRKQKQTANSSSLVSTDSALLVTAPSTPSTNKTSGGNRNSSNSNYNNAGSGGNRGYGSSKFYRGSRNNQRGNSRAKFKLDPPPVPYPSAPNYRPNYYSAQPGILGAGSRPSSSYAQSVSYPTPTDIESAMYTMSLHPPDDNWYMDTGATSHMTGSAGKLMSYSQLSLLRKIIVGNGNSIPIQGYGHTSFPSINRPLYLSHVLHAPQLVKNLISVRRLTTENNISIDFDPFGFTMKDFPQGTSIMRCNSSGDLYPLYLSRLH